MSWDDNIKKDLKVIVSMECRWNWLKAMSNGWLLQAC
jgi:hypothetical protein